jgi:predicted PurR-regulated permease PerM
MNTSSIRELGANLGASAVHRVVLFGISLLTLFFLFRHGESISMQCRTASQKLFGERGERVALQMVASVGRLPDSSLWRSARAFCWGLFTF